MMAMSMASETVADVPPAESKVADATPVDLKVVKNSEPRASKRPKPKRPAKGIKKELSSIAFPYSDLDAAITVARAIVEGGGYPVTRDQLAGALKQAAAGGAFILKVSAARQFGLVDFNQSKFQLTDLGFAIVDKNEAREKAARAQAFLSVPLYRRLYDDFKGRQLPPRPLGFEQTLVQLGVTPKQKANARIVFERSARQAGFSTVDPDRLIEPILGATGSLDQGSPGAGSEERRHAPLAARSSGMSGPPPISQPALDPLIQGLLTRLPKAGDGWSKEKRERWLTTLRANLDMIYPLPEDGPNDDSVQGSEESNRAV